MPAISPSDLAASLEQVSTELFREFKLLTTLVEWLRYEALFSLWFRSPTDFFFPPRRTNKGASLIFAKFQVSPVEAKIARVH